MEQFLPSPPSSSEVNSTEVVLASYREANLRLVELLLDGVDPYDHQLEDQLRLLDALTAELDAKRNNPLL